MNPVTPWNSKICNTPVDILIDSILLLAIVIAYILQILRIVNIGSTQGISAYFVLFTVLFDNYQLAGTLTMTAFSWPTNKSPALELIINSGQLRGSKAFGAVLGLVQVTLQWVCSVILLIVFAAYPRGGNISSPTAFHSSSGTLRALIAAIAFVHAVLFLFPAVSFTVPKRSQPDFGWSILMGLSSILSDWLSPLFVLLRLYPQFLEMGQHSGTFSPFSFAMQALVFIAVGVRWFVRLGQTMWGRRYIQYIPPRYWLDYTYSPLGAWYSWGRLPLNLFLDGIGCTVLVAIYLRLGSNSSGGSSTPN